MILGSVQYKGRNAERYEEFHKLGGERLRFIVFQLEVNMVDVPVYPGRGNTI